MKLTGEQRAHFLLSLIPYLQERKYLGDYHASDTLCDLLDAVERAGLTVRQREVYEYVFLKGKTLRETANIMGLHLTTVARQEKGVVKKLAALIDKGDYDDELDRIT